MKSQDRTFFVEIVKFNAEINYHFFRIKDHKTKIEILNDFNL